MVYILFILVVIIFKACRKYSTSSTTWSSQFSCFRKIPSTVVSFPQLFFPHQSFYMWIAEIEKNNLSKIQTFALPFFRFCSSLPATSFPQCGRQKSETQLSTFLKFFLSSFVLPQWSFHCCLSTGRNEEVKTSTFHDFDFLLSSFLLFGLAL